MDNRVESLNKSHFEEKEKHVTYVRKLYSNFWIENSVTIIWILLCNYWSIEVGNWVSDNWWLAILTGTIAISLLILVAFLS